MRQFQTLMNGRKLVALSCWTFAYLLLAAILLGFATMGDCFTGAEGAACREQSGRATTIFLIVAAFAYFPLTWLMFFRRR